MSWTEVALVDVCKPKQWKTIPISALKKEGYPVYGANGVIGFYDEFNHLEETLMITCRGATCGTINLSTPKSYITGNAMALDDLDRELCDINFLYYYLSNRGFNDAITGTAQPQITRTSLSGIKIPLPPLSEQKRIAAILNEQMEAVEKARKATEAQLEAAKALPAAYLRAVFESEEANSWERRKLGDVCRVTKLAGFEYTKYVNYNPDGKYIALRAQNVRNTGLDLSNFVKITEDVASYLSRSKLDSGDIVMTFIGANIGEATWIDKNDMFYCAPNIARITPNAELIDCQFLTRLIHSSEFQRQIRDINESTAQQSLSMKNIRDFWVVFPTLSQQKQIASTLTEQMQEVERLKQNLKEQLDTINKLPAVLLSRAFKGEL